MKGCFTFQKCRNSKIFLYIKRKSPQTEFNCSLKSRPKHVLTPVGTCCRSFPQIPWCSKGIFREGCYEENGGINYKYCFILKELYPSTSEGGEDFLWPLLHI